MKLGLAAVCLVVLPVAAHAQASPWFGTWKLRLSDPSEKPETLVYSDAGAGAMRMVSLEAKSVIVTHLDGRPAPDIGSDEGRGRTLAVKATSPTSYTWTFSVAGKPIVQGVNTLSTDLKTFKEVSWLPAKPGEVVTLVYDRQ